ncbi:MAG: HD domain-containing protein [Lachnospiraceae bacterium]|nr:HD domain-containing protein [Lachnospiraceae bacterium]
MSRIRNKMTAEEQARFDELAAPILSHKEYQTLKSFIQHGTVTTYDHCVRVAEHAFYLNRKLHLHADEKELVTACLLHDFYLYDWHTHHDRLHGYHHPAIAAGQAERAFRINANESDAIRTHMWPLTLLHMPSGKVAWLLTGADKYCSLAETIR